MRAPLVSTPQLLSDNCKFVQSLECIFLNLSLHLEEYYLLIRLLLKNSKIIYFIKNVLNYSSCILYNVIINIFKL